MTSERGEASGGPPDSGWLRFHERKSEVRRRFGRIWDIPLLRKRSRLLDGLLRPGARVLDFGAGGRSWEEKIRAAAPEIEYRSCDPDRRTRQDYHALEDVEGTFDLILMIEVIEHVSFDDGVALLARLRDFLTPKGNLLLTTPNTHHPTQYWQDPTHRTPWAYDFLGAAILEAGYQDLRFFRLLNAKAPAFVLYRLLGRLARLGSDADYVRTIALLAARGEK